MRSAITGLATTARVTGDVIAGVAQDPEASRGIVAAGKIGALLVGAAFSDSSKIGKGVGAAVNIAETLTGRRPSSDKMPNYLDTAATGLGSLAGIARTSIQSRRSRS
jgi:hypothetical protein